MIVRFRIIRKKRNMMGEDDELHKTKITIRRKNNLLKNNKVIINIFQENTYCLHVFFQDRTIESVISCFY